MSKISVTGENGVNITVTPQAPRPIEIKRPGVQGIQGDKGDQGDAATIAVGTVTTVGPGDPAAVTNVGTPQEAVFDFSIPRGQPGVVHSVVAGSNVTVNSTDPANPVVNASGSVSSVAMTVPTGLSVSGSPITTSGTFALSYASGYQGYTTTEASKLSGIEAGADVTDAGNVGAAIHGAAAKTTPVDADTIPLIDSAASNVLKKLTWANLKTTLVSAFLTLGGSVQTITGLKRFSSSGPIATPTGAAAYMEAFCATATGNGAFIAFHRSGNHAVYFGLDTDNELKFGGWSRGANAYKIWHEANFTPGDYLPLSGGTITGPFRVDGEFSLNRAPGVVGGMYFHRANGNPFIVFSGDAGGTGTPVDLAQIRAEQGNNVFRLTTAGLQDFVSFNLTSRLGTVAGNPTAPLGIATKQYVDAAVQGWTELSPTATTTGTAIDWTSIPTTVTDIELWFNGVSTNGTDHLLLQIGTGGSPTTSGYSSGSGVAGSNVRINSTAGMVLYSNNASFAHTGVLSFHRVTGNTWVSDHGMLMNPTSGESVAGGGVIVLAGALDNIRLRTPVGTATFDAGSVQVRYR